MLTKEVGQVDEHKEAVRSMQDYISEHLSEEITPSDLAKASSFSPWYARRLFIENLGMTPAVYIRRLKLSKSALRLRDENVSVLDVATQMGSEVLTDTSAHSDVNSAVIRKSTPQARSRSGYSLLR